MGSTRTEPPTRRLRPPAGLLAALRDRLLGGAIWLFALAAVGLFRIADATLDLQVFGYEHLGVLLRARRPVLIVVWHGRAVRSRIDGQATFTSPRCFR